MSPFAHQPAPMLAETLEQTATVSRFARRARQTGYDYLAWELRIAVEPAPDGWRLSGSMYHACEPHHSWAVTTEHASRDDAARAAAIFLDVAGPLFDRLVALAWRRWPAWQGMDLRTPGDYLRDAVRALVLTSPEWAADEQALSKVDAACDEYCANDVALTAEATARDVPISLLTHWARARRDDAHEAAHLRSVARWHAGYAQLRWWEHLSPTPL